MIVFISIFVNIFVLIHGSCPFMHKSLHQADFIHENNQNLAERAIENGYTVEKPQPAWKFANEYTFPTKIYMRLKNSTALLIAEQYYEQTYLTQMEGPQLSKKERLAKLRSMTDCVPKEMRCKANPRCNPRQKYRTLDGTCNNLKRPKVGSAYTQYTRLLQAVYNDDIHDERRSVKTGASLKSPRAIGNILYQKSPFSVTPTPLLNVGGLFFGQGIAHDTGLFINSGVGVGGNTHRCCSKDYTIPLPKHLSVAQCHPIDIPQDDPFYSHYNMTCMNFVRAQTVQPNNCQLGPAEILTVPTSFLDASFLYGISPEVINSLRSFEGGKLKTDKYNIMDNDPSCSGDECYILNDTREIAFPVLFVQLSILLRYHNFLANELSQINDGWDDETSFQEARRILIASYQHIVIDEWLKIIIGEKYFDKYLRCNTDKSGYCGSYNSNIDPGTLTAFSMAALRFFHAVIPNWFSLYSNATTPYKTYRSSDLIGAENILKNDYMGVLQGSLYEPILLDKYSTEARNHLFRAYKGIGVDLSSLDLARGRDAGLPPYYQYMEFCEPDAPNIQSWSELETNISPENIELLKMVYDDVHDVDLIAGIYLENKQGYLGSVARCIYGAQFHRLINGDRFFYTFKHGPNPFTKHQLKEIYKINFARILCQVTDVKQVPEKAFQMLSEDNQLVNCDDIPEIDLTHWRK